MINESISPRLQGIITERLAKLRAGLDDIQKATGFPEDLAAAIYQDVADVLQDNYEGLHYDLNRLGEIEKYTTPEQWDALDLLELLNLFKEYGSINIILSKGIETEGRSFASITKEYGGEYGAVCEYEVRKYRHEDKDDLRAHLISAHTSRHIIYILMILRVVLKGHEDEVLNIRPTGCSKALAKTLQDLNTDLLQDYRRINDEAKELSRTTNEAEKTTAKGYDVLKKADKVVKKTLQNATELLCNSIQVADGTDGPCIVRPLIQALEEKRRQNPAFALTSQSVTQAYRGVAVLSQDLKPVADADEFKSFRVTLGDVAKACTGQAHPNTKTLQNIWAALNFISTQRTEFIEYRKPCGRKTKGSRDLYAPYKITTTPISVTFVQQLAGTEAESDRIKANTEVYLNVHHIITEGRRQETITLEDGTKAFIKKPVEHLTTEQQLYTFNSDEGIRFFNTLLSKSNKDEDDLMAVIFQYKARTIAIEAEITAARKTLQQISLTPRDKAAATEAEAAAMERLAAEEENIKRHKPRDRAKLQDYFIQAKEVGVISWYCRSTSAKGFTWKWGRPKGKETKRKKTTRKALQ